MSKKVNTIVTPHIQALEKQLTNKPRIKPKWKKNVIDSSKSSSLTTAQRLEKTSINEQQSVCYQALTSQQSNEAGEMSSNLFNERHEKDAEILNTPDKKSTSQQQKETQKEFEHLSNPIEKVDLNLPDKYPTLQQQYHHRQGLRQKEIEETALDLLNKGKNESQKIHKEQLERSHTSSLEEKLSLSPFGNKYKFYF